MIRSGPTQRRFLILILLGTCFLIGSWVYGAPAGFYQEEPGDQEEDQSYPGIKERMVRALNQRDGGQVRLLTRRLVDKQPKAGIRDIVQLMDGFETNFLYYALIAGLADVTRRKALEEIKSYIIRGQRHQPVATDLFFTFRLNDARAAEDQMLDLLRESGNLEIKCLALDEIGNRQLKRGVNPAISILEKANQYPREVTLRAERCLSAITGKDLPHAKSWRKWWNENKDHFEPPGHEDRREGIDHLRGSSREGVSRVVQSDNRDIIAIEDGTDEVSPILDSLGISHSVLTLEEFRRQDLEETYAVLIGCLSIEPGEAKSPGWLSKKIKRFLRDGGYLFTTDLILRDFLQHHFPGYITRGKDIDKKPVYVYPADPGLTGHFLLSDVFYDLRVQESSKEEDKNRVQSASRFNEIIWKPTGGGNLLTVRSEDVDVLLRTGYKKENVNDQKRPADRDLPEPRNRILAATFLYPDGGEAPSLVPGGKVRDTVRMKGGRVLHIKGHFVHQEEVGGDGYALEQMLVNFLIEAKVREDLQE